MSNIAFIGLGNMGSGMCANLAKAGHQVRAFDLNTQCVDNAVQDGALAATSIAQCVSDAEYVITMLPASQLGFPDLRPLPALDTGFGVGPILLGPPEQPPWCTLQMASGHDYN